MRGAPVTRAAIVAAGLGLLDEGGLGGLTLRRLAERLHIRAPTLYWHVKDKRELIELLADAIVADAADAFALRATDEPTGILDAAARALAERLTVHRDGAVVVAASAAALGRLCSDDAVVERLVSAGCSPALARVALEVVTGHVLTTALREANGETSDLAAGVALVARAVRAPTFDIETATGERPLTPAAH